MALFWPIPTLAWIKWAKKKSNSCNYKCQMSRNAVLVDMAMQNKQTENQISFPEKERQFSLFFVLLGVGGILLLWKSTIEMNLTSDSAIYCRILKKMKNSVERKSLVSEPEETVVHPPFLTTSFFFIGNNSKRRTHSSNLSELLFSSILHAFIYDYIQHKNLLYCICVTC